MTASIDGVIIKSKTKNRALAGLLVLLQFGLSIFLYISLAAHIIWPEKGQAVAGVSQMIAYEGYLTDTNGDPLGGTGTPYCFRFSIYDNPTVGAGSKLWPAGTPATTKATTTEGVYSALIGQADALTYNFYDNDTVYLNVEVNTVTDTCAGSWETLGPRQPVVASGYALASESVYGDIFRTDISNGRAQVGTGAGGASPKFLGLDVKNTNDYIGTSCTTNGTVWYNSAISKALVCENSLIQAISNAGTSTIAAITANDGSGGYATTGTIVFSNSNGVSFGVNGNTITASVNAGGGNAMNGYIPYNGSRAMGQAGNASSWVIPINIANSLNAGQMVIPVHYSQCTNSTLTASLSVWIQVFTRNGNTLSNLVSASYSHSINGSGTAGGSVSNSYSGLRHLTLALNTTLSPGNYWIGLLSRTSTSSNNASISNVVISSPNNSFSGFFGSASTNSQGYYGLGYGTFSATRSTTTGSFNISEIRHSAALLRSQPFFFFTSTYT